jgi:hypothetical protein
VLENPIDFMLCYTVMMTDRQMIPDEQVQSWFEGLSENRKALLAERIQKAWEENDAYTEDSQFEVAERILVRMMVQDSLDALVVDGLLEVGGVGDDGELIYIPCGE